jgi:hypothetical protein
MRLCVELNNDTNKVKYLSEVDENEDSRNEEASSEKINLSKKSSR